jgi:hypothetical protein
MIPARMDEHEAYTNLIEALKVAEAACRQLMFMNSGIVGQTAKAQQWGVLAGLMGRAREQCTILATRRIAN